MQFKRAFKRGINEFSSSMAPEITSRQGTHTQTALFRSLWVQI